MSNPGRTLICSVLFLDIAEYSKRPVEDQIEFKQTFNRLLRTALARVAPRERIIIDTGDGAAVTFPGDPEDALLTAIAMRDSVGHLPVRLGINLGPVRLVRDINKQMSIIGDGINVAQRVMSFSTPGQVFVSRSFYEVVSRLSSDYEGLFEAQGSRTDKHVREHEVYSVVSNSPEARLLIDSALRAKALDRQQGWMTATGVLGLKYSALLVAPLAFALAWGAGLGLRGAPQSSVPATAEQQIAYPRPTEATSQAAEAAPRPGSPNSRAPAATTTAASPSNAAHTSANANGSEAAKTPARAPRNPGQIHLAVTPWGEVYVDGKRRGVSPPLRSIEVTPGSHVVEIRNGNFPAHIERIQVGSGDQVRIRHGFR